MSDMGSFQIRVEDLAFVGQDLHRPECVLATARGDLYVSDKRGGVTRIHPDGRQTLIGGDPRILTNGLALQADGSCLIANLGGDGGVWHLAPDGRLAPHIAEVEGRTLPAVNFVRLDEFGRTWICANPPLADDRYRTEKSEGFIAVADARGARVVAEGIGWANECLVHGHHLYINETFGRRLTRFDIGPDASLSNRTNVAAFGPGIYPDGLAMDEAGAIWVVSVASNRLIRVTLDGAQHVVLDGGDPAHVDALEAKYAHHALTRSDLTGPANTLLQNISSIAFGGPDRRTIYLGSIGGNRLATFRSPVAGAAPVHWDW